MTTNDDQYVPTDGPVRYQYVVNRMREGATRTHAEREYTRWLAAHDARVRRDAAREALDGLIAWHRENAQDAETPAPVRRGIAVMADEAQRYRDTHYPEETP